MNNSTALSVMDGGSGVTLWRKPEQVLAEAKEAAVALMSVVKQKKDPVIFNNEQYLEREDWGTLAKFFGCTAKTIETNYVNFDGIKGWEAVAVCVDADLKEIGRAESMCLSDEPTWGDVPVYEWQDVLDDKGKKIWDQNLRNGKGGYKAKRVQTGTAPKPLFQLRSMAQTRAEAKVLKSVFGYVAVLAGYKASVAEEMTGNEPGPERDREPEKKTPDIQRKSEKGKAPFPPAGTAPPKKDDVICAECRMKNGAHESICSQHPDKKKEAAPENAGDAYEGPDPGQEAPPQAETPTLSREEQWNQYPGHDEKIHISFKQGGLLFKVTQAYKEEDVKKYLLDNLKVEHRPLILKKDFNALLDAFDPNFEFHKKEEKK